MDWRRSDGWCGVTEDRTELTWIAKLPLARNRVFVRQMALVLVIPLALLGLLMLVLEWPPDLWSLGVVAKVVLLTGAILLALCLLVVFGVLRGRQELRYTLDAEGVRETTAGPLKHMNIVRLLLVLTGKPTYAGIGLITPGPQSAGAAWKHIDTVVPDARARTITLRTGRTDSLVVHCTPKTYEQALAWVQAHVEPVGAEAAAQPD